MVNGLFLLKTTQLIKERGSCFLPSAFSFLGFGGKMVVHSNILVDAA
jgi:hypothetical protein